MEPQAANPNDPAFQQWLRGVLHDDNTKNLCVVFTKKDGSQREMFCTLSESRIPTEKQPKTESEDSEIAGSAIRVFDTEKQEWRSFRWDSIKEVRMDV